MTEAELSTADRSALHFVRAYARQHGRPPSYAEVGAYLGLPHTNNAKRNCDRLVKGGFLAAGKIGVGTAGRPRALRLDGERGFALPVAGWVAAGAPIPPAPPDGEVLELERVFGDPDVRLLRVRGESMIEAAIRPGDYVAVRPCARADDGRLVVAEIDGGHTLKVFRVLRGGFYLHPRNKELQPIKLRAESDPRVLGVFVGLIRVSNGRGHK